MATSETTIPLSDLRPDRRGDWMCTYTGIAFWPLDPRPEEVSIVDIAHALSNLCRFAGHCRTFYSVAQHSVHVADIVRKLGADRETQFAALLHDATEAYVVDVPRPLKPYLRGYDEAEEAVAAVIRQVFGLGVVDYDIIKHADYVALATEKRDLMSANSPPWSWLPHPDALVIEPLAPMDARAAFMEAFGRLDPRAVGGACG